MSQLIHAYDLYFFYENTIQHRYMLPLIEVECKCCNLLNVKWKTEQTFYFFDKIRCKWVRWMVRIGDVSRPKTKEIVMVCLKYRAHAACVKGLRFINALTVDLILRIILLVYNNFSTFLWTKGHLAAVISSMLPEQRNLPFHRIHQYAFVTKVFS